MLTVTKTKSVASRETTKERSVGKVAVIPEGVVEKELVNVEVTVY
jgi:hypothetical protein